MNKSEITKEYIVKNLLNKNNLLNPNKTKQLFKELDIDNEFLYLVYHSITYDDIPKCQNEKCNNKAKYYNFAKGYHSTCGNKECLYSSERTNKIQKSRSDNIDEITTKTKETWNKKSKEDIEKITSKVKSTKLERYGDENYLNHEKAKKTNIERYGSTTFLHSDEGTEKVKSTKLERYGDENYLNHEKAKKTRIDKRKEGRQYTINPNINLQDLNKEFIEKNFFKNGNLQYEKFMNHFNCKKNFMYVTMRKLDIKINNKNNIELEINEIIKGSINDRTLIKPLEIDVLSHEHKFGIEYNGLIWHSFGKSDYPMFNNFESELENIDNHINKTQLTEEKGYQLFHIFENEWLDEVKKKIWVSSIKSKMNLSERIYARKTIVKEVDSKTSKQFLENNHLQGNVNSSIRVGLYHDDELVSIMTFGKSRFNKDYEYELLRMCNIIDTTVIGGFSKMLKYFERTYKPITVVSYANRRWSQGNVYEKNGFTFSHNSKPNFYYFKSKEMILYSRNKFQKHKLKDIDGFVFDEELSGKTNMFNNDYRIIYDSGNKVYFKRYNE